mmetsp:Transcript_10328/g.28990  ORF Transcript_10328/g.28990 Transcript_10328/m.28990 type:complete len:129 (+) Transcript_10328:176-562(+)|eukprot:CAMPEP_0119142184 /NCGR_PEP_ID=MMETSP1310-20130426/32206_1 /TAXON_ID=464262 /ORGANISM="Genus nov. species nov., Strain RCC2339" /LENGTH=128 /DNA_ID=CAMNT_0007133703 /DNA_START=106 /DNA_END=492 /DNA_ORIENTATION=+
MLARMQKEHLEREASHRRDCERKRRIANESVGKLSDAMMESVNDGVSQIFSNQRRIEDESQKLRAQSARFAKQTSLWLQSMEKFYDSFKELGDVENWASIVEQDMRTVTTILEIVHKGEANVGEQGGT